MGKHTPGPWEAEAANPSSILPDEGRWDVVSESAGSGFRSVAMLTGPRAGLDARLMAAAPELLSACRAALDWFESVGADGAPLPTVRAAIAKAEARHG